VQQACTSGILWDYSQVTPSTAANTNNATLIPGTPTQYIYNPYSATVVSPTVKLANYAAIAYSSLSGVQISNLSGNKRGVITPVTDPNYGVPITYNLSITPAGLLSLSYSYNGGATQAVMTAQNITAVNGALPAKVRFGFAGSMGGSQNTHELMCFKASPPATVGSSAGVNLKQSAQVQTGSQVYFAKYNPQSWAGSLTSQFLVTDGSGALSISPTVNWDAACVLTGGTCASTGATGLSPQGVTSPSRTLLSWSGGGGIPFEWSNLTSAEQAALDTGDPTATPLRLNYLRGDRTQEQNSVGAGLYRSRTSVLGDIIDSGATWVGPPSAAYPVAWQDTLYPTAAAAENSGQTYPAFMALEQTRTNVVYAGANDGFLHGFRTGAYTAANVYDSSSTNDGLEVLAYMPGYVEQHIQSGLAADDYSSPQYGHHFDVDAPPGTGDLFYGGAWHTWLVGGLGAGGSAIYALDITDASSFAESNAASVVIGEWSSSPSAQTATFSCAGVSNASTGAAACGNNLGATYGTPQIKRFHNGSWGVVFGNGFGSSTGDAGVYLMLVDPASGAQTFYYLGTGQSGTGDGIANATAADLDGDHVVDYIYAGDLSGNVWRFDVTSTDPANWAVQSTPIFTTGSGQPITSKVIVALVPSTPSTRVMVEFGTGQQTQFSNTAGVTYSSTQQYLYGVWDWNLTAWNANNSTQFGALPSSGFPAPSALAGTTFLVPQTITSSSSTTDYRTVSSNPICWADTAACSGSRQYGWYLALASGYETGNANSGSVDVNLPTATPSASAPSVPVYEQVIYNPVLAAGAFIVNTTIPSTNSLANCNPTSAGGWTMAIDPATGGAFTKSFFNSTTTNTTQVVNGIALNGTGTPSLVTSGNSTYLVTQTVAGNGAIVPVTPPAGTSGKRLTWTEKR
jgi:type IV pilus assembly protein PilY1